MVSLSSHSHMPLPAEWKADLYKYRKTELSIKGDKTVIQIRIANLQKVYLWPSWFQQLVQELPVYYHKFIKSTHLLLHHTSVLFCPITTISSVYRCLWIQLDFTAHQILTWVLIHGCPDRYETGVCHDFFPMFNFSGNQCRE